MSNLQNLDSSPKNTNLILVHPSRFIFLVLPVNIRQIPAHPNNYTAINTQKVGFVMHWIVGELSAADASFTNPNRRASAHYGIGSNGEIHQYVATDYIAWHAGNWTANTRYIGLEHAGGQLIGNNRKKPTRQCHEASVELITALCRKFGISKLVRRQNFWIHREFAPTACPGSLDVDWIMTRVNQNLNPPKPQPDPNLIKIRMAQDLIKKLKQLNVRLYNYDRNDDWTDNLESLAQRGDWQKFNDELASVLKMTQNETERQARELKSEILQDQVRKLGGQNIHLFNHDRNEDWADNLANLSFQGNWQVYNTELASILRMKENECERRRNELKVEILTDQLSKFQKLQLRLYNYDQNDDWTDNLKTLADKGNWQLYNTELASILKMTQNELKKARGEPL